jgi:hypothetical protein
MHGKYTPAPWTGIETISGPDGKAVCDVVTPPYGTLGWANSTLHANAALIAAAPDMLEVLKKVERTFGDRFPEVVEVIAKAEGR